LRSTQEQSSGSYRADIDGLRAIAILVVVLYHAGVPFFRGGFVGVDIFFVISGALIGAHVYSDIRRKNFRITDFYRRRAKRILPALFVVLIFCYITALLLLSPAELVSFGSNSIAAIGSCSNLLSWYRTGYFATGADQNPLLMTWSLGVEEQFYVIFPLLMLLLARLRRRTLFTVTSLITLLSLAVCIAVTPRHRAGAFYLLPTRAWELSIGILLAIYENGRLASHLYLKQRFANLTAAAGLLLIGISVAIFDSHIVFPGGTAMLPVFGAALILSSPASWVNRFLLSSRPLTFIGLISYSLYLWHWPLLSFVRIASDRPISVATGCTISALSLVCAYLSYRFVEQRFRASATPTNILLLRYGTLCLFAALPGVLFISLRGLPSRFPPSLESADILAGTDLDRCFADNRLNLSSTCVNTQDPRPVVALLGDSHAKVIAPELHKLANQSGYNFYEITRSSCLPILTPANSQPGTPEQSDCASYNQLAHNLVEQDPKVRVVILAAYWAASRIYGVTEDAAADLSVEEKELASTLSSLQASKKQIVVLQDVPIFKFDPLRRTRSHFIPLRDSLARLFSPSFDTWNQAPLSQVFLKQNQDTKQMLARVSTQFNVNLFDPMENLCTRDYCTFFDDQSLLYVDQHHCSPVGAKVAYSNLRLPAISEKIPLTSSRSPAVPLGVSNENAINLKRNAAPGVPFHANNGAFSVRAANTSNPATSSGANSPSLPTRN
jgi:peptidoglycan/LPS O-acetylase OafA/YrhL